MAAAAIVVAAACATSPDQTSHNFTSVTAGTTGGVDPPGGTAGTTAGDPNADDGTTGGTGTDPNGTGNTGGSTTTGGVPPGTIPTSPPPTFPSASGVSIMTAQTNLCVQILPDYTLVLAICDGSAGQRFQLTQGSLRSLTGTCLDISGGVAADGVPAVVQTCAQAYARKSQQWSLGGGQIRNAADATASGSACLGITGAGGTGAAVIVATRQDRCSRFVIGYDGATFTLVGTGKCLAGNGTALSLAACLATSPAQLWTVSGDGELRLAGSDTCVDVGRGGVAAKTGLVLSGCNGGAGQEWNWNAGNNDLHPRADTTGKIFVDQGGVLAGSALVLGDNKPYGPAWSISK